MEDDILINNNSIWENLASSDSSKNIEEISKDTGIDEQQIRISLSKLSTYKLIYKEKQNNVFYYKVENTLDAFSWAKAVEIGVEIETLEKYAKLVCEEDSLEITTNGRFEEEEKKKEEEKIEKRNKFFYGKAATEAAKTDLAKLVKYKENAIEEYKKSDDFDEEVEKFLLMALESIQYAYENLIKSYLKNK